MDGHNDDYDWEDNVDFHAEADTTTWEDGDYCFIFNPTESAGDDPIRLTQEFMVDNTPPSVPVLTWPINGIHINDNSPFMQWKDSTDDQGVAGYYYRVRYNCSDEDDPNTCSSVYPSENGLWRNNSEYQAGGTSDGVYFWQVRAEDINGNKSDWSELEKVVIDTAAPEITLVKPEDDDSYDLDNSIIKFKATCNETCDYINFWWTKVDDPFDPNDRQYHYVRKDGTEFVWDGLDIFDEELWKDDSDGPMEDGEYKVYAAGKDLAGNWARTDVKTITVDTDIDDDKVIDNNDMCSDTESETIDLKPNRFAWPGLEENENNMFDVGEIPGKNKGKAKGPGKEFSLEDTHGCNCQQIVEWLGEEYPEEYGEMEGHLKHGCSSSVMEDFIDLTNMEE